MKEKFTYTQLSETAKDKARLDYLNQFLKPITKNYISHADEVLSKNEEYFDKDGNYLRKV